MYEFGAPTSNVHIAEGWFTAMRYPPVPDRSVLVTGCSTGIGRATARLLRARGWRVFATARKPADLESLRAEGFEAIAWDAAEDGAGRAAAAAALAATGGRLGGLVNNAGYGQPGAIEDLTRDALRRQFEVNLFGLLELTNALIPTFRKQRAGRIVNVGSVVGRVALPFLGAYSSTKFALAAATAALRVELRGTGIAVALIEPGPIATAFSANARAAGVERLSAGGSAFEAHYRAQLVELDRTRHAEHLFRKPPEAVAKRIAHALEAARPRRRYPVTAVARFGALMARWAPDALLDAILARRR